MKLSVVIVNYNTRDLLRACLASVLESPLEPEIIVVDNASSDGSAAMVAREFPSVTLLAQPENRWFCGGNNIGVRAAGGEYVLLLNPDTVVQPGALATLVRFMDAHPDYAGVTAQLRYPDGTIQQTCSRLPAYAYLLAEQIGFALPKWQGQLRAHHWYADEGFTREHSRDVEVLPGSCLLMRRGDLWLDDDLLLYFPEDDLARRFAGRKFRFVAEARITHHEKSATHSWRATQIYFRDMRVYARKHHGWWGMALLWLAARPLWLALWARHKLPARTQAQP